MPPPPVTIYVTSLTSQPKVRQHIDLLHRSLKALEIPYESFDLVNDPDAKTRWQRAKPPGKVIGLPGYLVGGEWVGTMDDFEEAVESQTLPSFLKQDLDLNLTLDPSSTSSTTGGSTVGQAELERLMREMSDADLDALAGELGVGVGAAKVGLMVPEGAEPLGPNESDVSGSGGPTQDEARIEEKGGLEDVGVKGTAEVMRDPELEKGLEKISLGEDPNENEVGMEPGSVTGTLEEVVAVVETGQGKQKVD